MVTGVIILKFSIYCNNHTEYMYYSLVVFINEGPNFNPENLGFMKHKIVNAHPYYSYMISHDLTDLTPKPN